MYPLFSVGVSHGIPVPYRVAIIPSLSSGTQIHINGTPTGDGFEVNLTNEKGDMVLHFNPRFDQNRLVLNSAQEGIWGQEQREPLPIQRGIRFAMVISASDSSFTLTVNNIRVGDYHHRIPSHLARLVEVKGQISLESVQVYAGASSMRFPASSAGGMGYCPSPPPAQPAYDGNFNPGYQYPSAPRSTNEGVPSIQSCRIHAGSRIFVRGFIHPGANRFELNLLQGYSDGDDVAFHFNPRFDARTIVKNHRRNGQWGHEENQPFPAYMPLMPGSPIDLEIACLPDRYTVFMNGSLIAEFHHKIPPGYVLALQYKGDITVSAVGQL